MAGVQLAFLGAAANQRWDGAQGPSYWRKRPTIVESLAAQRRTRGGYMPAADQIGVVRNHIEPVSGAAAWYEKVVTALNPEIAAAQNGIFPSATVTDEFATVVLGHLALDQAYVSALQAKLSIALPAVAIAAAEDYMPSRASGVLVKPPSQLTRGTLSPADTRHLNLLRMELDMLLDEGEQLAAKYVQTQQHLLVAQETRLLKASRLVQAKSPAAAAPAAAAAPTVAAPAAAAPAGSAAATAPPPPPAADAAAHSATDTTLSTGDQAAAQDQRTATQAPPSTRTQPPPDLQQLEQDLQDAEQALQEVEDLNSEVKKDRARNNASTIQTRQQIKDYDALTAVQSADIVKAFPHPEDQSRICTAHDCITLKLLAAMDVVYGISTELQQIRFSELQQGKGVGVPAEESVREFAARIQLHINSTLNMDPSLAHVQFFSGLVDKEIAAEAERVLQSNPTAKLDLPSALNQVQLIEHRRLHNLVLKAANGDAHAAAELKRKAAGTSKRQTPKPDTSKDDTKPKARVYHPDPNHPDAKCKLPGHTGGKGHSNKECRQGGSASTAFAHVAAATAAPAAASSYQVFRSPVTGAGMPMQYTAMPAQPAADYGSSTMDLMAQWQQAADTQRRAAEEMSRLSLHYAHAMPANSRVPHPGARPAAPKPPPPPRGAAASTPSAHGNKCNICGYPFGHSTGICYYEFPDKRPDWRPSTNAPPHMINHWRQRRHQLGLPPADPRPPPMAALTMPVRPALPAPSAPPIDDTSSTGYVISMPAIARFDFSAAAVDRIPVAATESPAAHMAAAMPRSFLQYPAGWHPDQQFPVIQGAQGETADGQPPLPSALRFPGQSGSSSNSMLPRVTWRDFLQPSEPATPALNHGSGEPVTKRLRYCDELDRQAQQQGQTAAEEAAALAALAQSQTVPCLDTFVNLTAATGLSFQLADGRWQLPSQVVVDSGATYGVGWADAARDIGLRYTPSSVTLVLADGTKSGIAGLSDPVKLVFAKGTAAERVLSYRFIILQGKGQYYNWLIGKNALLELGAFVDPAESAFVYRLQQGQHKLPVRCTVPADEASPADCLYTLQPMLATLQPSLRPAALAAGPVSA